MDKDSTSRPAGQNSCPDFLIIGVQKGGTTTLYNVLVSLGVFSPSKIKELHFFDSDTCYQQGIEWYANQFSNSQSLRFEATPRYLYHPSVPQRIYKFNPNCKFIIVLREPASRCYSAYKMFKRFNGNPDFAKSLYLNALQDGNCVDKTALSNLLLNNSFPSFRIVVEEDLLRLNHNSTMIEPSFVRRGLYANQIKRFLNYFTMDQFLIFDQSELNDIKNLYQKISSFLQVDININTQLDPICLNVGEKQHDSNDDLAVIAELKSFYSSYNEDLFDLIGRSYNWE